jgi:hypothetical protein
MKRRGGEARERDGGEHGRVFSLPEEEARGGMVCQRELQTGQSA